MSYRLSITTAVRVALGAGLLFSAQVIAAESVAAAGDEEELETLEDVVVTARNREESVQDIPIPVTVLGAEKLQTYGIQTVWDLEFHTPNIELNPPGENVPRYASLSPISGPVAENLPYSVFRSPVEIS